MKHLRIAISALMIIIAFNPLTAHAQTKPKPNLAIMMEELSDESVKCGVRKETIRTSATLVLRQNNIDVSNDITNPAIYISVTALPANEAQCVYHLSVDIRDADDGIRRNGFFAKRESVVLCAQTIIVRSFKQNLNKNLSDYTENLLKDCLARINY